MRSDENTCIICFQLTIWRAYNVRPNCRASQASKATLEQEPIDEGRRKRVAENLLEKASQRAAAAKAELKAAAASARREAETGGSDDDSTATATSEAAKTTPQVVGGAASG